MEYKYKILNYIAVTLEGKGIKGIFNEEQEVCNEIKKPTPLKGIAPRVDYSTSLCVMATKELENQFCEEIDRDKVGIIIGTKTGNHQMARGYADKVRKGMNSSMMYSTSGYNMCAGISALANRWNGPSLVLADTNVSFDELISLAGNYLEKGDAKVMVVGQIDVNTEGTWGLGIFMAISKEISNGQKDEMAITLRRTINKKITSIFEDCKELVEVNKHTTYLNKPLEIYLFCRENNDKELSMINRFGEEIVFEGSK